MQLLKKVPIKVKQIIEIFHQSKGEIYIVGGAVRDMFVKKKVKDWDFATNLTPPQIRTASMKTTLVLLALSIGGTFMKLPPIGRKMSILIFAVPTKLVGVRLFIKIYIAEILLSMLLLLGQFLKTLN